MEQEDKKDVENPLEESSNPPLSTDKDDNNKDTNPAEESSKPESSNKNTQRSLKAKSKVLKKSKAGKFKVAASKGLQQIAAKKKVSKNKVVVGNGDELPKENSEKAEEKSEKMVASKGSQQIRAKKKNRKNKAVVGNGDELPKEQRENGEENKEKESQNKSTNITNPIRKRHRDRRNKIVKVDKSEQEQRKKGKHGDPNKGTSGEINKAKYSGTGNTDLSEQKREKPVGFIFMCSAKTKPDCFHYHVMGVSAVKKDMVLSIKPGTKLFLYDFDLKLLYGIYKASSSGGMKLEPRAFGGNFPAQVRFNVASDCFPLPESIFRKAIKENYNEKNKFKTELTARQVRKLTELFRPVDIRSALPPGRSPPKAIIREREVPEGSSNSWTYFHRERPVGDPYPSSNVDRYNVRYHGRDPRIEQREEVPRDLFLTEKSYRAYGLQGDRRNVASASQVNPILDYERDRLHHTDPLYRKNASAHGDSLHADHIHLRESEHQTYTRGGAISGQADDPYHAYRYGASPRDPYLPPLSREEISSRTHLVGGRTLIGSDNLPRRDAVPDRLYSTYSAADALSEYNRMQDYRGESLEATAVPVSSRYAFAGPSYSLR